MVLYSNAHVITCTPSAIMHSVLLLHRCTLQLH